MHDADEKGKHMSKAEMWTIAYRKKVEGKTLLNDVETPFTVVPNTWRYWCADPHLYEYQGKTWLFAELYDRVLCRGVIGCRALDADRDEAWRVVMREPFHLSYPHIFELNGEICMIPESYVANEMRLYRAVKFPEQWELVRVLKTGYCAVDTTVFEWDGVRWMLTFQLKDEEEILRLLPLDGGESSGDGIEIKRNDPNARPAGHLFRSNGGWIRPAQDCTESYGCALNFYQAKMESGSYSETIIHKIRPVDIRSNWKTVPEGIHTYNFTDCYEVIDLKGHEVTCLGLPVRAWGWGMRRLKRLLGRK